MESPTQPCREPLLTLEPGQPLLGLSAVVTPQGTPTGIIFLQITGTTDLQGAPSHLKSCLFHQNAIPLRVRSFILFPAEFPVMR